MIPDLREWSDRCERLIGAIDTLNGTIHAFPAGDQQQSRQQREWEPFVLIDGGTTDSSGNATIGGGQSNLLPAATGWESWVERVAVTVQGASSAATVQNYHGGVADQNLFDAAGGMFGNSPSRIVADYNNPVYFVNGQHISIVVTGAAVSSGVVVRIEGKRRQV